MRVCIGFTNTESYLSHEAEVNERLCVYEEKRDETAKRCRIGDADEKNATGCTTTFAFFHRRSIISLIMRNTDGCSGYRSRRKPLAKALLAAGKTIDRRKRRGAARKQQRGEKVDKEIQWARREQR